MEAENYKGYRIWGHAIVQQEDILQQERFAASGTITQDNKLVVTSGVLGAALTKPVPRLIPAPANFVAQGYHCAFLPNRLNSGHSRTTNRCCHGHNSGC
jgi:hypothetical protein